MDLIWGVCSYEGIRFLVKNLVAKFIMEWMNTLAISSGDWERAQEIKYMVLSLLFIQEMDVAAARVPKEMRPQIFSANYFLNVMLYKFSELNLP